MIGILTTAVVAGLVGFWTAYTTTESEATFRWASLLTVIVVVGLFLVGLITVVWR